MNISAKFKVLAFDPRTKLVVHRYPLVGEMTFLFESKTV